jgi:nucleoside-diphosphate-sugar epimerase
MNLHGMNLLCLGYGYSVQHLVRLHGASFARVSGTVRTAQKAIALAGDDVSLVVYAGDAPDSALQDAIAQADVLVASAAPGETGDPFLRHLTPLLAAAPRLRLMQYLSTVGVYGDHGGGWVDEDTPARPGSERGQRRLLAEKAWQALGEKAGKAVQIHRLAGIYGPGRCALDDLAAGTARRLVKSGQVFSRIHVEDIAGALLAGIAHGGIHVFNVCDNEPAPPQDVVAFAAGLMGVEPPPEIPFEGAVLSEMARSFYGENKRCSNRRLKDVTGYRFQYPTYREGLTALHAATG